MEDVDQWTVNGLRNVRPLYKYSWPDGQHVYVNGNTAEVAQYTTTSSRFWGYLGAVTHWFYFTPLRKHQPQWFSFVVWSSLIGAVSALIGVVTTTWAFSGLLSMGPFPIVDKLTELTVPSDRPRTPQGRGTAGTDDAGGTGEGRGRGRGGGRGGGIAAALSGRGQLKFSSYAVKPPNEALASARDFGAKELEHGSFAGEPVYFATNARGETRIIPVHGEPKDTFDTNEVMRLVREAAGPNLAELHLMDQYDAYYLDRRRERPLPVVYARMNDKVGTRYYIDPKTARVVATYSARGWVNRWLYHGLHSLDFPWLYNYRPLWDIVVIALMLGGTAVCVTSIVLTWRVLARKLAGLVRARFTAPSEDLALETEQRVI